MTTKTFADFEIWIGAPAAPAGAGIVCPTRVISSPAGSAWAELKLALDEPEFEQKLTIVRSIEPDLDTRQSFGELLFKSLFQGDVLDVWNQSLGRVDASPGTGLRLRLWIDAPRIALLPWELLYEPSRKTFLAIAANMVMSRYLPVPEPPLLAAHDRLRILVVVESPVGPPPVTVDEVNRLIQAIAEAGDVVEPPLVLRNPTVGQIQAALQKDFHVFHYLGHGRTRQLILTGEDGQIEPIDDRALAMLFRGRGTLRLVVLSACNSSQSEDGGLFEGVGPALVEARIPAVVAMQYPTVQLDTAGRFGKAFYSALANGIAIDAAVNEARLAIAAGALLKDRDWSTPVLYMGTRTGQILNFESTEKTEVEHAWQTLKFAAKESEQAKKAFSSLIQRFQQVAALQRRVQALAELTRLLADVRLNIEAIDRIVARADGSGPKLQPDIRELKAAWGDLFDKRLAPLRTFVAAHQDLDVSGWLSDLDKAAEGMTKDVKDEALRPLAQKESLDPFSSAVARSEALVKDESARTMETLLTLSDRTLGAIPEG